MAPFAEVETQLHSFKLGPGLTATCPNHKRNMEEGSGLGIWWRLLSPLRAGEAQHEN